MAYFFLGNNKSKQFIQIPLNQYKKAIACAKTFDWEELEDSDNNVWPRSFKCKKTGLIAERISQNDPVMFTDGDLLLLTSNEVNVRNIIT